MTSFVCGNCGRAADTSSHIGSYPACAVCYEEWAQNYRAMLYAAVRRLGATNDMAIERECIIDECTAPFIGCAILPSDAHLWVEPVCVDHLYQTPEGNRIPLDDLLIAGFELGQRQRKGF